MKAWLLCMVALSALATCLVEVVHPQAQSVGDVRPANHVESSAERTAEFEMIRQLARQRGGHPEALAQVIQLGSGLGDAAAAELIEELAAAHLAVGDLNLAAEVRTHLVERYPADPLAERSLLWLVRLYASSEVAHARRGESPGAAVVRRQLSPRMAAAMHELKTESESDAGVATRTKPKNQDQLALYSLHLAARAMQQIPAIADEPALAFQRSVAARQARQGKTAQAYLSPLKHRGATDPWGQCARTEAWLEDPGDDAAPKPIIPCTSAAAPPHLDGVLDEACWQRPPTRVSAPTAAAGAGSAPVELRLAHDDEHLYVALECPALSGVAYELDDNRPRPRDGDVQSHDRVRILLDVDRDYGSWFELIIDSRGWTADRCWGDVSWNPEWFVARATSTSGDAWIIEAAIPLAELAAGEVDEQTAWACFIERVAPSAGAGDGPSSAAASPGPEDFGVLLFD
jgi:hypothetical protein